MSSGFYKYVNPEPTHIPNTLIKTECIKSRIYILSNYTLNLKVNFIGVAAQISKLQGERFIIVYAVWILPRMLESRNIELSHKLFFFVFLYFSFFISFIFHTRPTNLFQVTEELLCTFYCSVHSPLPSLIQTIQNLLWGWN